MIRFRRMNEILQSENGVTPKSAGWSVGGYVVATVIYGVCLQEVHAHSQELKPLHRGFEVPIILTVADFVTLVFLLRFEHLKGLKAHGEGLIVTFICQTCAGYLFNYWYIYSRNNSFPIGYFEPIILIALLRVCTKTEVSVKVLVTLLSFSFCAGLTSGDIWILLNANRNGIIIFLVMYFISLRNVGIKLLQEESLNIRARRSTLIPYSFTVLAVGFILCAFHLTYWALPVMFALIAMFASVAMFYFTVVLLEHMHIISVSILGMVAQICVNTACVPGEHAHNIFVTILTIMALTGGIALYFRYLTNNAAEEEPLSSVAHHEVYTRMEFLIFAGVFCGILFYVFKPRLSKRDLNNLHYVGLDKLVKMLLNHPSGK